MSTSPGIPYIGDSSESWDHSFGWIIIPIQINHFLVIFNYFFSSTHSFYLFTIFSYSTLMYRISVWQSLKGLKINKWSLVLKSFENWTDWRNRIRMNDLHGEKVIPNWIQGFLFNGGEEELFIILLPLFPPTYTHPTKWITQSCTNQLQQWHMHLHETDISIALRNHCKWNSNQVLEEWYLIR